MSGASTLRDIGKVKAVGLNMTTDGIVIRKETFTVAAADTTAIS